jgi:hypothetical protein
MGYIHVEGKLAIAMYVNAVLAFGLSFSTFGIIVAKRKWPDLEHAAGWFDHIVKAHLFILFPLGAGTAMQGWWSAIQTKTTLCSIRRVNAICPTFEPTSTKRQNVRNISSFLY